MVISLLLNLLYKEMDKFYISNFINYHELSPVPLFIKCYWPPLGLTVSENPFVKMSRIVLITVRV